MKTAKNSGKKNSPPPLFFENDDETIEDISHDPHPQVIKEKAAKKVALYLIIGFLILLFMPFLYLFSVVFITGANLIILQEVYLQIIDMIKTLTAVLGGIVGAVVTYYFTIVQKNED